MIPYSADNSLCLVSFSMNSDHRSAVHSMFESLRNNYSVHLVSARLPLTARDAASPLCHYVTCPDRPGICKGTFNIINILKAINQIRLTGCNIIYFESVHFWNLFIMLALGFRRTCIQTLHDVVPHDGARSVLLCQKLLCRVADKVVIKSEQFRDEARRLYHIGDEDMSVVPVWRPYPKECPTSCQGNLLFFGRLRKYKGLNAIEKIILLCAGEQFSVIGEPDAASLEIAQRIASLSNVHAELRTVSDAEMEDAFASAGWVLLPYESASQSGVIIDAYRYGKPVIAFAVGAVSAQVVDGETGFLVRPGDIPSFVETVRYAARMSSEEYERFSQAAFRFGQEHYSAQALSDEFAILLGLKRSS